MVKHQDNKNTLITFEQQTKFRSGLGMLLYLVNHSKFEIINSARELSKVADRAKTGHCKLLLRCIKCIITTEYLALQLKANAEGKSFNMEWSPYKDGRTELKGVSNGAKRSSFNMKRPPDKDGRAKLEGVFDSELGTDQETRISDFG
jgi:hypothetical protein